MVTRIIKNFYEGFFLDVYTPKKWYKANSPFVTFPKVKDYEFFNTFFFSKEKNIGTINPYFSRNVNDISYSSFIAYKGRAFYTHLEVDRSLVIPYGTNIMLSITSDDVIHS